MTQPALRKPAAWSLLAVLAAGLYLAAYLAYAHVKLFYDPSWVSDCNFSPKFNCDLVNTSEFSELFGVPISLYALPLYVAAVLWVVAALRDSRPLEHLALVQLVGLGAVGYSLFLFGVSLLRLGVFCPFCMAMYAVNLGLLVLPWPAARTGPVRLLPLGVRTLLRPVPALVPTAAAALAVLAAGLAWNAVYTRALVERYERTAAEQAPSTPAVEADAETDDGQEAAAPTAGRAPTVDADDAIFGPATARVTVVEFADFQCGYCKRLAGNLAALKQEFGDRVRFVYKHFPMNPACNAGVKNAMHKNACEAASAGVCARRQGKFWDLHDLMFKNQHKLAVPDLVHYAELAGLDLPAFQRCLDDPSVRAEIKADTEEGAKFDIHATPRVFVNDQMYRGVTPAEVLARKLRTLLGEDAGAEVVVKRDLPDPVPAAGAPAQVHVDLAGGHGFYIDTFEASVDAGGRAVSLPGVAPAAGSWHDADAACRAAGKRTCTEEEWVAACQGAWPKDDDGDGHVADDYVEGKQYGYADFTAPGVCVEGRDHDAEPGPTGQKPVCRTQSGLYDMIGNVQEWVGAAAERAVLLGGDVTAKAGGPSCYRLNDNFGAGHRNKSTGFRCCSDAAVDNASAEAVPAQHETAIGKQLPPLPARAVSGTRPTDAELKDKVVMVAFMASWCAPCRREMPALNALPERLKDVPFRLIGVGLDTEPDQLRKLLHDVPVSYPMLSDPASEFAGALYAVESMPTSLLVDQHGVVRHRRTGYGEDTLAEVEQLVRDLAAGKSIPPGPRAPGAAGARPPAVAAPVPGQPRPPAAAAPAPAAALEPLPADTDHLVELVRAKATPPVERNRALQALTRLPPDRGVPVMRELATADPAGGYVTNEALIYLYKHGQRDLALPLIEQAIVKAPGLARAFQVTQQNGRWSYTDDAKPVLSKALASPNVYARLDAARALLDLGDREGVAAFEQALADKEPTLRLAAVSYAGPALWSPDVRKLVEHARTDSDSRVAQRASALLAQLH